jgi:CHAT domain-containing protein
VGRNRAIAGEEMWSYPISWRLGGADFVIASLWEVEDKNLAVFVKVFYKHLAETGDPVAALHYTMREMILDIDFSHPYRWASFQIWR